MKTDRFSRIIDWIGEKYYKYELLQRLNIAVFEYNAKLRERQIQLKKDNLAHLFDDQFYEFVGFWDALFDMSEQELLDQVQLIRKEAEDYEKAFSQMKDTKRSITEMLDEQKAFYRKKINQAEREYKQKKKY